MRNNHEALSDTRETQIEILLDCHHHLSQPNRYRYYP
jgi:hypothetical protein